MVIISGVTLAGSSNAMFLDMPSLKIVDLTHSNVSKSAAGLFCQPTLNLTWLGISNVRMLKSTDPNDVLSLLTCPSSAGSSVIEANIVDITHSSITEVKRNTFADLRLDGVVMIDISNNRIQWIEEGTFAGMSSLLLLALDGDNLVVLPQMLFRELTTMMILDLASNDLENLSADSLPESSSPAALSLSDGNGLHAIVSSICSSW